MGTASFSVSTYGRSRGVSVGPILSSAVRLSGAFTTSTTAASLADGSGAITVASGEVLTIHADEAMRVSVGGTATASTGVYIAAGAEKSIEVHTGGAVSIIDVA